MRILFFCASVFIPFFGFGQIIKIDTTAQLTFVEKELISEIDSAELTGRFEANDNGLENIFIQNLVLVLKSKRTFDFSFNRLTSCSDSITRSCIRLRYSNDSLFRIFNWLSPTTGTMHHSPAIIQAKSKVGNVIVYSSEKNIAVEGDIGGGVTYFNVFKLRNTDRQLYIAFGAGQASGRLPYETVEIFEVLQNAICDTTSIIMFEDKCCSGILIDRESSRYDKSPQEIPSVKYDLKNQIITIPEIVESDEENENTRWNGKLIRLKFDGKQFNRLK